MLDMVDYKAMTYAGTKGLERDQEIELLQKAAAGGESLMRIRDLAQRITQLRLRKHDYDQAAANYLADIRSSGVIARSIASLKQSGETNGEAVAKAAHYYRSLFAATIGRQMLDKWDAEEAQASKRMEAEHA